MKGDKFVRKIIKNGRGSYYLNLPLEMVRGLGLRERQKLTIETRGKTIVVKDWRP